MPYCIRQARPSLLLAIQMPENKSRQEMKLVRTKYIYNVIYVYMYVYFIRIPIYIICMGDMLILLIVYMAPASSIIVCTLSFVVAWKGAQRRYGIFTCTTILRYESVPSAISEVGVQEFVAGYGNTRRRRS